MKTALLIFVGAFVLFFSGTNASAQTYTVIYIEGKVYFQNTLIAVGQHLSNAQQLSSPDRHALVCFLHPKEGKLVLDFTKGKVRIVDEGKAKHSELYDLTVGDFIKKYDSQKMMATRGFDFVNYFHSFRGDSLKRLLVLENDTLPFNQVRWPVRPGDHFMACIYTLDDSICTRLKQIDTSYLLLSRKSIGLPDTMGAQFRWKLKFYSGDSGKDTEKDFYPVPYRSYLMTAGELQKITRVFKQVFVDSSAQQIDDLVLAHLGDFYGNFHKETAESIVQQELNKQ